MRLNFSFTVTARLMNVNDENQPKQDVELEFDLVRATAFLFRFYKPEILIDEYVVLFGVNNENRINAVYLKDRDNLYLVTNSEQLVNEVIKGYQYLITMDKVSDVLEYDFQAAFDFAEEEDIPSEENAVEEFVTEDVEEDEE